MFVKVAVICGKGLSVALKLCKTGGQLKTITVRQLKEKMETRFSVEGTAFRRPTTDDLRHILRRCALRNDDAPLSQYVVQHMSTTHVVPMLPGGGGDPGSGGGGMGDKGGKNRSMEKLDIF